MWLLAASLSARAGDAGVLVADLRALDEESKPLASILPQALEAKLATVQGVAVVPLEGVGPIHDVPARMYLASCPPGQDAGCAFVVAEVAGADYAIAGTVSATDGGTSVELSVVDVLASEQVIGFEILLPTNDPTQFAAAVSEVLVRVLRGEIGRHRDLRWMLSREERAQAEAERRELFAHLSSEVDAELAGVSVVPRSRHSRRVPDLDGRKGDVLIRPLGGFARAPLDVEYFGRYAREAGSGGFVVAESYASQTVVTATGAAIGCDLAFGLLPELEVGVEGGLAFGHYTVDVGAQTVGEPAPVTRPEEHPNANVFLGPQVFFAPFPAWVARPVVGASLQWWKATRVDDHVVVPEETGSFPAPSTWIASVVPGAEAGLTRAVDFFVHVPLGVVLSGGDPLVRHDGSGALELPEAPSSSPFGFAVLAGVQIRIE